MDPWLERLLYTLAAFWGTYEIVVRGMLGDDLRPEVLPLVGSLLVAPYARRKDRERQQEGES
jgi:hypothetical protein